jgi:RNA polymerase sigma-70 factor (ECF subfamily)
VKWLQAAAVREALSLSRAQHESPTEDAELADAAGAGQDPELDFIKERHRADFNVAFKEAFSSLDLRERTLLRMQYLDGLSIDSLATMHGVHRSTVARWQVSAREALLKATRSSLMAHLRLSREEFDSLMGLIQSRLGPSLHSFLRKHEH